MMLPETESTLLRQLWQDRKLPELRSRVRELYNEGWTLQSIADALQTYRSTVRAWVAHSHVRPGASTTVPEPPNTRNEVPTADIRRHVFAGPSLPTVDTAALAPRLSAAEIDRIASLSRLARRVRARTPDPSEAREAADELNDLLATQRQRGVPVVELADAAGLTSRAIRTRLPERLAPCPPLIDRVEDPDSPVLVLWPAPSNSRRWRTYIDARQLKPLAFYPSMLRIPPAGRSLPYHLLSPRQGELQLGWPERDTVVFPRPLKTGGI